MVFLLYGYIINNQTGRHMMNNSFTALGPGDIWLDQKIREDNEAAERTAAIELRQEQMLDDNEWVAEAVGENCLPTSELIGAVMLYLRDNTLQTPEQLVKIGEAVVKAAYDYTWQRAKEDV